MAFKRTWLYPFGVGGILNKHKVQVNNLEETNEIALKLATYLNKGDLITLEGELGVGKTTFVKGLAKGLNIEEVITSPTFTIIKEYTGDLPLYHMDAYRLEHAEEDIGFEEYFNGDGVSVVEWAQFIELFLPEERLNILMQYIDENSRYIIFKSEGKHYDQLLEKIFS